MQQYLAYSIAAFYACAILTEGKTNLGSEQRLILQPSITEFTHLTPIGQCGQLRVCRMNKDLQDQVLSLRVEGTYLGEFPFQFSTM